MDIDKVRRTALKHALKDRVEHGRVSAKAVLGKVIGEMPEVKASIREVVPIVEEVAGEVEAMPMEEVKALMAGFTYTKPERDDRIWIENPREGVVTRFPPEPSGYLHIGHAKAALLNEKIAQDYRGRVILRMDDTNPKKERAEYVEAILEDLEWLGFSYSRLSYTSDYIEEIYQKVKELMEKGRAYVSVAPMEEIRRARKEGRPIPGRERSAEENLELFEKMLANAFGEGEAVVLYKGRPNHPNTAMRDPTLMRVVEGEHYRQGSRYTVWPTYDMATPVVDSMEGVTHAIRSKEYELRKELYMALLEELGMEKPTLMHFSRLSIKGVPLSKRVLRELVERGIVEGWDDPRMPTLRGLRRRGIQPEAIRAFALRFGIGKQEKEVTWDMLEKENRRVLDKKAIRLMGVEEPVEVVVEGGVEVEAPFHPEREMGKRLLKASTILLEREDWEAVPEGGLVTLRYGGTFVKEGGKLRRAQGGPGRVVHWVPKDGRERKVVVFLPNPLLDEEGRVVEEPGREVELTVEGAEELVREGTAVQFERKFFARKDRPGLYIYSS